MGAYVSKLVMLKAETKPKAKSPESREYFMYAVALPRPEIEIVGFNLPNNDHKLHRPRIYPLCNLRHKQPPLNRQINFTERDTRTVCYARVWLRRPGENWWFYLFNDGAASAKPFNKQFPTGLAPSVPVFQSPRLRRRGFAHSARENLSLYPKYAGNKV